MQTILKPITHLDFDRRDPRVRLPIAQGRAVISPIQPDQTRDQGIVRDEQAALLKQFCTSRLRESVARGREIFDANGTVLDHKIAKSVQTTPKGDIRLNLARSRSRPIIQYRHHGPVRCTNIAVAAESGSRFMPRRDAGVKTIS